jgi:outer membrane protein insertion porin family
LHFVYCLMLQSRKVTFSLSKCCAVLLLPFLLSSCAITFVKRYPKNKPFVYQTNIRVQEAKSSSEKSELQSRLENQLDDSLRVRVRSYPLWKTINRPPVFDTNNVNRSVAYMTALMNSLGYFSADINASYDTNNVRDQQRVTIDFNVRPGKNLRFDSIAYDLSTPAWQQLAMENRRQSLLKKNAPYSKQVVAQELDRLIALLRDNGYYKVSKEDVYAEVDTVAAALIDPTLDPFEQAALLEELRRRREDPTIDIVIRQRPVSDSTHIRPYYINKVTIYPDVPVALDTFGVVRHDTARIGRFVIISQTDKFRKRFLTTFSALKPGEVYSQNNYFKTINVFNQLGAWQQANVDVFESLENDSTLDVEITLYPAKKFTTIQDVEISRNNANSVNADLVASSNLFGVGVNAGVRNRNFARQAIQTTTNGRFGVELGKNFIQTFQTSLSHNIYIPKFLPPLSFIKQKDSAEAPRTILSFNVAYTDRRRFFSLFSTNVAYGYEWTRRNHVWFLRLPNIEYTKLNKSDSLLELEKKITYLKYAFNDGLVISLQGAYRWQKQTGRHFNAVRLGVEESGGLTGMFRNLDVDAKLFRFVRADAEYRHWIQYRKSALAFRLFGGVGFAYGDSSTLVKEKTLPFFKQYIAGGPNSMRAWQVRQLGWGSYKPVDDTSFQDRFGDIQLEANVEYRFLVATLPGGIKMGSALYVDAGNIWLRKTFDDPTLQNAEFNLGRLGQDLAIAAGTGLRFDFNFFLIRLDYAYKVKDPQRKVDEGKWFYNWKPFNGQLQLGINYPF